MRRYGPSWPPAMIDLTWRVFALAGNLMGNLGSIMGT